MISLTRDKNDLLLTDPVEKLLYDLIAAEGSPINIHTLFTKAENKNILAAHEFKYALTHLLSNQLLKFDFDGNLSITGNWK
ncbi:MAG: hypothetical protein Q7J07_00165 [Pelolinea sp.]|nr:hypothetical protein [Pelolinea sp.]